MLAVIMWGIYGIINLLSKRIDKVNYSIMWICFMIVLIRNAIR